MSIHASFTSIITASQHHSIYHSITASQHHSITASQHRPMLQDMHKKCSVAVQDTSRLTAQLNTAKLRLKQLQDQVATRR
jgi:hypothetical protein